MRTETSAGAVRTKGFSTQRQNNPTPEQIAQRCAEIQATWSVKLREVRRSFKSLAVPWVVPEVELLMDEDETIDPWYWG